MMKKLENEVLLSRRAALGAFATVALGTAGLLAGCGSDKATVTEDAGDGDKKEEAKKEEQSTTDLAVGTSVTTAAGLSVVVDSVQTGLTNYDGSTMTGIHVTYVNNGDEGADYNVYDWKGDAANGAQQNQGYYSEGSDELQSGTLAFACQAGNQNCMQLNRLSVTQHGAHKPVYLLNLLAHGKAPFSPEMPLRERCLKFKRKTTPQDFPRCS